MAVPTADVHHHHRRPRRSAAAAAAAAVAHGNGRRRRRSASLPLAIVVAFVASVMLLMGGIRHTDKFVTQGRHHQHDVSFDPPVPAANKNNNRTMVTKQAGTMHNARFLKNASSATNSSNVAVLLASNSTSKRGSHFNGQRVTWIRRKPNKTSTARAATTLPSNNQLQDSITVKSPPNNNTNSVSDDDDILNVALSDRGVEVGDDDNNGTNTDKGVVVTDLLPKVFPHYPQVPHLGVLVDAGRHYFPLDWLKDLVDVLARMHFTLIHFRLTDDQAFNIQLDGSSSNSNSTLKAVSQLAHASAVNNPKRQVYDKQELMELVAYAAEKNISIMPEINVPGHAGAWAGAGETRTAAAASGNNTTTTQPLPGFVVPCPEFICQKGYGIPLNLHHPQMLNVIRDVIVEVRDIFQTSPYLHLGGDEVEMSAACFQEAGMPMFNYTSFEYDLKQVLIGLNISLDHVLRWEMSPGIRHKVNAKDRAGNMMHWWVGHGYKKATNETAKPWFVSQGLYFDSNQGENGWSIYKQGLLQASLQHPPTAIIGGTFELSTVTWVDRNVLGRLLAVAMGAAKLQYNTTQDFEKDYLKYCHLVGIDERQCSAIGMPVLSQKEYMSKWNLDWDAWKSDICERLTVEHIEPVMKPHQDRVKNKALQLASREFWNSFGLEHPVHRAVRVAIDNGRTSVASLPALAVDHLGLVVDLVQGTVASLQPRERIERVKKIIDDMALLGFNLLQLRFMDEYGMALQLHSLPNLAFVTDGTAVWDTNSIKSVVKYASTKGIRVMPEISISTRAGGWKNAGILAACPKVICGGRQGVAIDSTDSNVMQIFALVVRELKGLFSSQFLHLGYDERQEAAACYKEAKLKTAKLNEWEQRLEAVLRLEGIVGENVLRWENTERFLFPHRAGLVTNYRDVKRIRNSTAPFFVTTDLGNSKANAWDIYQRTNEIRRTGASGIMSSIGVEDQWDSLQIRERLLTVAMGAREMRFNDASSLQSSFVKACNTLKLKNCQSFLTPSTAKEIHQHDYEAKRKLRAANLCEAVTDEKVAKMPRKGILVPE